MHAENYTPFLPYGIRGCFTGASVVFFSYIGFDTVRLGCPASPSGGWAPRWSSSPTLDLTRCVPSVLLPWSPGLLRSRDDAARALPRRGLHLQPSPSPHNKPSMASGRQACPLGSAHEPCPSVPLCCERLGAYGPWAWARLGARPPGLWCWAPQVSTAAEETRNPGRDLPLGIVGSLSICTVLYVLMCLVITGMQPFNQIDLNAPFSVAFRQVCVRCAAWRRALRHLLLGTSAAHQTRLMLSFSQRTGTRS